VSNHCFPLFRLCEQQLEHWFWMNSKSLPLIYEEIIEQKWKEREVEERVGKTKEQKAWSRR